jgi:site-specific DNA-methyltransferase (adenine-specific)
MPEQLLARIIRACSSPGEIILDPFSGSASTLITAKKLARRFIGCELSQEYSSQGTARLAQVSDGDPLVGSENPLLSAPTTAAGRRLADKSPPVDPSAKPGMKTAKKTGKVPPKNQASQSLFRD